MGKAKKQKKQRPAREPAVKAEQGNKAPLVFVCSGSLMGFVWVTLASLWIVFLVKHYGSGPEALSGAALTGLIALGLPPMLIGFWLLSSRITSVLVSDKLIEVKSQLLFFAWVSHFNFSDFNEILLLSSKAGAQERCELILSGKLELSIAGPSAKVKALEEQAERLRRLMQLNLKRESSQKDALEE